MNISRERFFSFVFAVIISGGALLWIWNLDQILESPLKPDIETGHVIPFMNHGKVLYITHQQNLMMDSLLGVIGLSALAVVAFIYTNKSDFSARD